MSLLGLGCDKNIEDAVKYFMAVETDQNSLNALGVIYFGAPDVFETDPVKLHPFGKIRKDVKKARKYFE